MIRTLLICLVSIVQGRVCGSYMQRSRNQRQTIYLYLYMHRKKCVPPERQSEWSKGLSSVEDPFVLIKFRINLFIN